MSEVAVSGELTRVELDDGVATLRLDRPKVNALTVAMLTEIRDAARWLSESGDVRAVTAAIIGIIVRLSNGIVVGK